MKFEEIDNEHSKYKEEDLKAEKKRNKASLKGINTKTVTELSKQIIDDKSAIKPEELKRYKYQVGQFLSKTATKKDVKDTAKLITSSNPKQDIDDRYAKQLSYGARKFIEKDITKQTVDQDFADKKTREAVLNANTSNTSNTDNTNNHNRNKVILTRQGQMRSDKYGNVKKSKEFKKGEAATKTSDAILTIPAMSDGKGNLNKEQNFFITFKTTENEGGAQDNQKNDVENTLDVIDGRLNKYNSLAVLDGDYYLGKKGRLSWSGGYSYLSGKKYKNIKIVIGGKSIDCPRVMSLAKWLNLIDYISKIIYVDLRGYVEKHRKIKNFLKEEDENYLLIESENEVGGTEKFISSLNNIQNAMKKQNMDTSRINNIKNKLKNILNFVKEKILNIKNKLVNVKDRATYAIREKIGHNV